MNNPTLEKTVVLIKPDGVKRGLIGEIVSRFEKRGLKVVGMKMVWVDEKMIRKEEFHKYKRADEAAMFGL